MGQLPVFMLGHVFGRLIDFDWLLRLRSLVVHEFERVSWPDPESVDVMVESEHRVKAQGGWNYFR